MESCHLGGGGGTNSKISPGTFTVKTVDCEQAQCHLIHHSTYVITNCWWVVIITCELQKICSATFLADKFFTPLTPCCPAFYLWNVSSIENSYVSCSVLCKLWKISRNVMWRSPYEKISQSRVLNVQNLYQCFYGHR